MPSVPASPPAGCRRYPDAHRDSDADQLHGVVVPDPYRWLEDRCRPDTQRWCTAQDELWTGVRGELPDRAYWGQLVRGYLDVDYASAPIGRGGVRFAMRHSPGFPRPQLLAQLPDASTADLLDGLPPDLARAGNLQSWQPSLEGGRIALALSARGSEDASLCIMDVATGQLIDGPVPGCRHTSVAWLPGADALYYARSDTVARRVYRRRIGSPPYADEVVFEDLTAPEAFYSVRVSPDGRWLAISGSDGSPAAGNDGSTN